MNRRNRVTVVLLAAVVAGMVGLSFAAQAQNGAERRVEVNRPRGKHW